MAKEIIKASFIAGIVTILLALLILLGSRNLAHFDAALVAYTFATLFATFGITYRYAMWLQRPPTALYWKRGLSRRIAVFAGNNAASSSKSKTTPSSGSSRGKIFPSIRGCFARKA
jgi:hypothetical protein